ncbi:MAG: hypothetical protein PHY02_06610 [Phycisphaerae bacterium]|nr:hypothetical protein [Phycisphaerae bacterium]
MVYWVAGSVIFVAIIYFMINKQGAKRRNRELDTWGASIPISNVQQEAMTKLWEASQIGKPPSQNPLQNLSSDDREYLLKICSADFRPAKFGNANVLRYAAFSTLIDKGFNPEHAAIIVGMIFNGVGKKNFGSEEVE